MPTVVRAIPILLFAALPALADLPSIRQSPSAIKAAGPSVKTEAVDSSLEPVGKQDPARGACELAADPANLTHWLAYKQLDQWVPCEPGQAIDVRFLISSVPDSAQAHFCAPQMPIARQMTSGGELGRLRCIYAGHDLAAGRKGAHWAFKPLPAAVPYRLATLSEPIVAPASTSSAASAATVAAAEPAPPAKSARPARPTTPARAGSSARP